MTTQFRPDVETVACVCGRSVRLENWSNHLQPGSYNHWSRGPHAVLEAPRGGLTVEETRLLQRLDMVEADPELLASRRGKLLQTRISRRLTDLALRPEPLP